MLCKVLKIISKLYFETFFHNFSEYSESDVFFYFMDFYYPLLLNILNNGLYMLKASLREWFS